MSRSLPVIVASCVLACWVPAWKAAYADAWDAIAAAERIHRGLYKASRFQQLRGSSAAAIGATLVRCWYPLPSRVAAPARGAW